MTQSALVDSGIKTLRHGCLTLLGVCLIGLFHPVGARADLVIVSGDEWTLSNQAFLQNPASTNAFATNLANFLGGADYLIYEDAGAVRPYGTAFQSLLGSLGRTVTVNPAEPFSAALLAPFDAVFLAGSLGSGAANAAVLNSYVQGGGAVYLSLGTGISAPQEAAAWNPFLNSWGLNAGAAYFPDVLVRDIPTVPGTHPLQLGVSALTWGFGQEVTELDSANPLTEIAITGAFGAPFGDRGMIGVARVSESGSVVPEPVAFWLWGIGGVLIVLCSRRSLRRVEA